MTTAGAAATATTAGAAATATTAGAAGEAKAATAAEGRRGTLKEETKRACQAQAKHKKASKAKEDRATDVAALQYSE